MLRQESADQPSPPSPLPSPLGAATALTFFNACTASPSRLFLPHLHIQVRRIVEAADGYSPHLVAPEAGYRRLIADAIGTMRTPAASAVERVAGALQDLVVRGGRGGRTYSYSPHAGLTTAD